MSVLVVGGGIAGASAAYFLAQHGVEVAVVDAGQHGASSVPSALLNPVRGQAGRVPAGAVEGLALTWALVDEVTAAGHVVPHGRSGVVRPVPDARTREKFARHLPDGLDAHWLDPSEVPGLASGWHAALLISAGGWLGGSALCVALLASSGARVIRARATARDDRSVTLDSGERLTADAVLWCGGSVGRTWAGLPDVHRAGTLLTLDRSPGEVPLSFGAYFAPSARGGVLGATFEAPADHWAPPALPATSLRWLLGKGEALRDLAGLRVTGRWTGSRLGGELRAGRGLGGVWQVCGLGSHGFLLGPLNAQKVAAEMAAHLS